MPACWLAWTNCLTVLVSRIWLITNHIINKLDLITNHELIIVVCYRCVLTLILVYCMYTDCLFLGSDFVLFFLDYQLLPKPARCRLCSPKYECVHKQFAVSTLSIPGHASNFSYQYRFCPLRAPTTSALSSSISRSLPSVVFSIGFM